MEEPTVREQAVQSLIDLAQEDPFYFCKNCLFLTISKFASWNQSYTNKVSAATLVPICYPNVSDKQKRELVKIFVTLSKHDMPMVRRACADKIDKLAQLMPKQEVKDKIYPLYEVFMKDKRSVDSVRIKAIESSIGIIRIFNDMGLVQGFMDLVKQADSKKQKWRVRYAIGETLCHFTQYLQPDVVQNDIFPMYREYLKDKEQEIRSIAVQGLPMLCGKTRESKASKDGAAGSAIGEIVKVYLD